MRIEENKMCLEYTTDVSLEGRVMYYKLENVSWK